MRLQSFSIPHEFKCLIRVFLKDDFSDLHLPSMWRCASPWSLTGFRNTGSYIGETSHIVPKRRCSRKIWFRSNLLICKQLELVQNKCLKVEETKFVSEVTDSVKWSLGEKCVQGKMGRWCEARCLCLIEWDLQHFHSSTDINPVVCDFKK